MRLGVACEIGKRLADAIIDADVITRAVLAEVGIRGVVECCLEHRAMDHRFRDPSQVGGTGIDQFDGVPNRVGMTTLADLTEHGACSKGLVFKARAVVSAVIPVVVSFTAGVIDPILRNNARGGGIALCDRAPSVVGVAILTIVAHLTRGNLLGGDHADPRAARQPAHIRIVAVRLGVVGEVPHVAP